MGKKTSMEDLRDHLFETLERLKDPDPATPMDIDTAKTIISVAETLIDSQRVENDFIKAVGGDNYLANSNKPTTRFLEGGNGGAQGNEV